LDVCGKESEQSLATYHRATGEIVTYMWGKRDKKTVQKLRKRFARLGIHHDHIATDDRDSFFVAFTQDEHFVGKQYTVRKQLSAAAS
jgi:IS1 family transposase